MKKLALPFLTLFFGFFLIYPLLDLFRDAFVFQDNADHSHFTLRFFSILWSNHLFQQSLLNSFIIAFSSTALCLILALPISLLFSRYDFSGKNLLQSGLLLPLILPPFVGAIGIKQFLARFGSLNLLLAKLGIISIEHPIDWLGSGGLWGVVLMQVLHLYPILVLSVTASLAQADPSLREAAANLGASPFRIFRTISLPLALPGIFAGTSIVFISAFTDLGTPLMFDFQTTIPSQIFNLSSESSINPIGQALVITTLVIVAAFFWMGKRWGDSGHYAITPRGASADVSEKLSGWAGRLATGAIMTIIIVSIIPHLGVIIQSFSQKWFFTVLPGSYSTQYYADVFRTESTVSNIQNSLLYSSCSAGLDLILGVLIAYLLARESFFGKGLLDMLAMLPLALPGLILAFGYLTSFNWSHPAWINPRNNPTFLLIISYSVRRLPYIVRAAYAGFQQTSVSLEEASLNLGASRWMTLRRITLPLVAANLVAGTILTFSFAMLEVSDSLLLAMESRFAPITRGIYELMGRPSPEASSVACALGVLAMLLLGTSLLFSSRILGRKMGSLFKA